MIERKKALVPAPSHALTTVDQETASAAPGHEREPVPAPPRKRVALFVAVPLIALLAWGGWSHYRTHSQAAQAQQDQQDFVPEVRVGEAKRVDAPVKLTEPGQTLAYDTANILARSTGYVSQRLVDIGSRVKKGDLMLQISAPDLDQQLVQAQAQIGQNEAAVLQAQASLAQAQSNVSLADVTKYRTTTLASQGWETKQNADNSVANAQVTSAAVTGAQAGIAVAQANLEAQRATVQRLQALASFERITAPFDGVVTARNVDTGDLLTADAANGTPLLTVARDDVLRVSVYVPQSAAIGIRDGVTADVTVPELPGRSFKGTVSRNASALDASARAMLTEVDIDNRDHLLRPGLYVDVNFDVPRQQPGVVVPDDALVFDASGLKVGVVEGDTVHFRKVAIYRDFGTTAELREGLAGGEKLVLTPPTSLQDGSKVRIAPPPEQEKKL